MSFKKCKDLILGIVMLLLSGFYLIFAQQIKTRPKLTPSYASAQIMPTLLGAILAVLSIVCIIQGIRRMKAPDEAEETKKKGKGDLMAVMLTFAVIIGYILVMPTLGFILYLFLQMLILAPAEKRNYVLLAIITAHCSSTIRSSPAQCCIIDFFPGRGLRGPALPETRGEAI